MSKCCIIKNNTPELRQRLEQAGHAVAQWLLEHPNQNWNNNYLYADLDKWRFRLDLTNKDYSTFHEPDLNNQLTAIALQDDGRMFKKLKLVGNY